MPSARRRSSIDAETQRIIRPINRGTPGDQTISSGRRTPEKQELARRKSQYYGEAFAHREQLSSARERVINESIVLAEISTNVIITDEFMFMTGLSYVLSQRYQRPEKSIVITVAHSACLLFAGNFDPAYAMAITALPTQVQPVTNKRNALLLGKAMEELLGVPSNRGLIKFVAVAEESVAYDGTTLAGRIEDLDRDIASNGIRRGLSRMTSKSKKRSSVKSLRNTASSNLLSHDEHISPSPIGSQQLVPPKLSKKSHIDHKTERTQKMGRRRSFMAAVFGKT